MIMGIIIAYFGMEGVMVERSDRMWFTGDRNGKPLQYSCLENPVNSMKRSYIINLYKFYVNYISIKPEEKRTQNRCVRPN